MDKNDFIFNSDKELEDWLKTTRESYYIELKKAQELPNAFWESYSAFANTSGGIVVLGVEESDGENIILGVSNPSKTLDSLWNQLSNTNKVSYKCINNEDVALYVFGDKTVIIVYVHEAPNSQKPVYLNGKLEQTYIRTGDGDRKATKDELGSFLRNAQPIQDDIALDLLSFDDLDKQSLVSFKERVSLKYPNKKYDDLNLEEFLIEIGGAMRNRKTGKLIIKKGTLLFLGKVNSIKEFFPHYHVDYFNRRGNNERWLDRVTDDEPSEYEMNIYNFYNIVFNKMTALLLESFELDAESSREPVSGYEEPLRECLVNCLAHADYEKGYPSIKVEAFEGWFRFVNPGQMLISVGQFFIGGDSRPRNEVLMKYFRYLGASERQGFGGPLIIKAAMRNSYRRPEIVTDIEHTEVKIWNIDIVDSHPELTDVEKVVYRYIIKNGPSESLRDMARKLNLSEYKVRIAINALVDQKKMIRKIGNARNTRYIIDTDDIDVITQLQLIMDAMKRRI